MTDVVIDLTRPAPLPSGVLVDIAIDLARATAVWRPHAGNGAVRLLATESYEAWVVDGVVDDVAVRDHGESVVVTATAAPTTSIRVYSPPLEAHAAIPAVHDARSYVRALDAAHV